MQLHKEYGDKVECYTVSLDFDGGDSVSAALQDSVLDVLRKNSVHVNNIVCSDPVGDVLDKLGLALPAALVYDQTGELKKTFNSGDEPFNYEEDIIPYVKQLLGAQDE